MLLVLNSKVARVLNMYVDLLILQIRATVCRPGKVLEPIPRGLGNFLDGRPAAKIMKNLLL